MEAIEVWKDVDGYGGKYQVSNLGKVWNTITDVEVSQVLTGIPQYKYVNLRPLDGGKRKLVRVHRLVAEVFVDNPDELSMVDHIDRDKMNNHVSNLRWVNNSGNQKNKDGSVYIEDVHITDFVSIYEKPNDAYSYLHRVIREGLSPEQAVEKYDTFLEHGDRYTEVLWEDNTILLNELCNQYNVDYLAVSRRLSSGWDIWNALYGIPSVHHNSFQVASNKGVGLWYPNNCSFETHHPNVIGIWKDLVNEGRTLDEILVYDGLDHLRQTVGGVHGTLGELCKHFNKTMSNVETRLQKGMTLRDALLSPPERIKKVTINGISGSPKYWYEHYGLDYKKVKRKKGSMKCSFEEVLKYFNVDVSNKTFSYTD